MIAHAVIDHTPNHQIVTFHHVSGRKLGIFGHQHHLAISMVQTLAHALGIERRNDDVAMPRRFASVDDHQVTVENTGTLHAVPRNLGQVHVRCPDFEQLIQRYQPFEVIRCFKYGHFSYVYVVTNSSTLIINNISIPHSIYMLE